MQAIRLQEVAYASRLYVMGLKGPDDCVAHVLGVCKQLQLSTREGL
jgi:hypothetical protein